MKITIDATRGVVTEFAGEGLDVNVDSFTHRGTPVTTGSMFAGQWDDLQGTFDQGSGAAALTYEEYRHGFSLLFMRHDQNDVVNMRYQMSHEWNYGLVRPHIHFMPVAPLGLNVTQSIDFGYQIGWFPANGGWPTSWVTGSVTVPIPGSNFEQHLKVGFGLVSASASPNASDILFVRLMRSGSASPLDTYTTSKSGGTSQANVAIIAADTHFQKGRAGTTTEFV